MSQLIERTVGAGLIGTGSEVTDVSALLRYACRDPLAVTISFPPQASLAGSDVSWVFARDLLAAGLRKPSGEGDIRVQPVSSAVTVLEFHAPEGMALVQLSTAELRRFLDHCYAMVPWGREEPCRNLDRELAALLRRP
ncbi:SsgA family sporulation/cell division regulator [Streptomyces sp. TP-A0874]|uniref:SsgA family sporulation/cell division regulator n=1 Tax=Streptomyces sp. TP-A0874 TaxID=549819 RepID=UPI000852ECF0|nr:SsgA family sporulation/cell division regulator [Streptomyces sp. TP-A0874]